MHVHWAWELLLSPCPLPLELGAYTARRSACCAAPAHVYLYAAHGAMCALWQKAGWEGWQGLFCGVWAVAMWGGKALPLHSLPVQEPLQETPTVGEGCNERCTRMLCMPCTCDVATAWSKG